MQASHRLFLLLLCPVALFLILLLSLGRIGYAADFAQQAEPLQALGSISGTVTDENGNPIPGIEVQIYDPSLPADASEMPDEFDRPAYEMPRQRITTIVDSDGTYRFSLLKPKTYRLEFRDPQEIYANAFYSNAVSADTSVGIQVAGNHVTDIDMTLAPGGSITGMIVAAPGITLNDGLQIFLQDAGAPYDPWQSIRRQTLPAIATSYVFTNMAAGDYRICMTATITPTGTLRECYDDVAANVIERAEPITVQSGQVASNVDFILGSNLDYGTISGRVTDINGNPLQGIRVSTNLLNRTVPVQVNAAEVHCSYSTPSNDAITDQNGYYSNPYAIAGNYRLSFHDVDDGYHLSDFYRDPARPAESGLVTVNSGNEHTNIDAVLQRGGTIRGQLNLGENMDEPELIKALLPTASVRIREASTYYDSCGDPGRAIIFPPNSYEIRGLRNGRYVVSADVNLNSSSHDYFGYGGYYHQTNPAADYGTPIAVNVGETVSNIDIWLNGSAYNGVISGTVTAEGQPLAGIRVNLYEKYFGDLIHTFTDNNGRYLFEGLGAQEYHLSFVDPQKIYATVNFPTSQSFSEDNAIVMLNGTEQITNVNISLVAGALITGTVTNFDGQPMAGTTVTAYSTNPSGTGNVASTHADGYFELGPILPGEYRICFRDPIIRFQDICMDADGNQGKERTVTLAAGDRLGRFDINLPSTRWTDLLYLPSITQP